MRLQRRRASIVLSLLAAMSMLVGCAPAAPEPSPTQNEVAPTPTATITPTPAPQLVVGGTAGQNRPLFEYALDALIETTPRPSSRQLVDTLAAAGFDKSAMEVTADSTPLGTRPDSILLAVQVGGQCLVSSVGDQGLATDLTDVLGTGRCLVGRTLSIDW